MKKKKIILITIMLILCTTGLVFANEIKILKNNNKDYISVKDLTKNINKKIIVEKYSSFAKIENEYYPIKSKELDGFKVPVNEKPLYKDKEAYINEDFLKNSKIIGYTVKDNKIIIDKKGEQKSVKKFVQVEEIKEEINDKIQRNEGKDRVENIQVQKTVISSKPNDSNRPVKANNPTKSENNNNNSNSNNDNNSGDINHDSNRDDENNTSNIEGTNESNNGNDNKENQNADSTTSIN